MRRSIAGSLLIVAALTIAIAPGPARGDVTRYIVQPGDYLVAIGLKLGVQWQSIAEANNIVAPYTIYPNQSLVIPPTKCDGSDSNGTRYTVKPGDDLVLIGLNFGVPWHQIADANCIAAPYLIYPTQTLAIPPPPKCADGDTGGTQYTVKAGDDLVIIGQHFGVPWQEIADANCIIAPYVIYPGQVLTVPQEQEEDAD
jgi:LysM repeat protein